MADELVARRARSTCRRAERTRCRTGTARAGRRAVGRSGPALIPSRKSGTGRGRASQRRDRALEPRCRLRRRHGAVHAAHPGESADVFQDPRREPRGDRDPGVPGRLRARPAVSGGLSLRGPQLPASAEGRRGLPDRRARPPGPRLPRRRRDRLGRARPPVPTPSTRVMASCRRIRSSPRRAPTPASRSSARRPTSWSWPATRREPWPRPARPGLPVLESTAPSDDHATVVAAAAQIGFPLFVKAVAGGGGRGMRRVENAEALSDAVATAMREAESAFGDPTVFCERAVIDPRHIEVQVLADGTGHTVHLFERDCSVQRRHQKVIEVAPAVGLDPAIRERMCAHAVAFARHIGYVNAGTVEFLLDARGDYVFIEMNPRIQVEHTVTEEITDVDLVASQIRIAAGETLDDLGLAQDRIQIRGAALQCRITSEDPANGFRPDTGRINTYRSPGGAGVRIDGGTVHAGAEVSRPLRLAAGQADLPRPGLASGVAAGPPGAGRIPGPRRVHQHPVPAGGAGRPRLRRRRGHHLVHRDPPTPADRPALRGPRHPAADVPRRRVGQQAARHAAGRCWSTRGRRSPSCRRTFAGPDRRPGAVSGWRRWVPSGFAADLRARPGTRGHRHHVPRRPPVAAGHQGANPGSRRDRTVRRQDAAATAVR